MTSRAFRSHSPQKKSAGNTFFFIGRQRYNFTYNFKKTPVAVFF